METLLPGGKPKHVRVYDNGGRSIDRYTVVFTGNYRTLGLKRGERPQMWHQVLAMNARPTHPQGFGQHLKYQEIIDYPTYGHLGKKIKFDDLPEECQSVVLADYKVLWGLEAAAV